MSAMIVDVLIYALGLGCRSSAVDARVWANGHPKDVRRHDGHFDADATPVGPFWPRS